MPLKTIGDSVMKFRFESTSKYHNNIVFYLYDEPTDEKRLPHSSKLVETDFINEATQGDSPVVVFTYHGHTITVQEKFELLDEWYTRVWIVVHNHVTNALAQTLAVQQYETLEVAEAAASGLAVSVLNAKPKYATIEPSREGGNRKYVNFHYVNSNNAAWASPAYIVPSIVVAKGFVNQTMGFHDDEEAHWEGEYGEKLIYFTTAHETYEGDVLVIKPTHCFQLLDPDGEIIEDYPSLDYKDAYDMSKSWTGRYEDGV